jgi:hypothetical protein
MSANSAITKAHAVAGAQIMYARANCENFAGSVVSEDARLSALHVGAHPAEVDVSRIQGGRSKAHEHVIILAGPR